MEQHGTPCRSPVVMPKAPDYIGAKHPGGRATPLPEVLTLGRLAQDDKGDRRFVFVFGSPPFEVTNRMFFSLERQGFRHEASARKGAIRIKFSFDPF